MSRLLKPIIFFAVGLLSLSPKSNAAEFTGYTGLQTFNSVSGCCVSVAPRVGYGVGLRLEALNGIYQVFGYTDMKWGEVSILKTMYLKGDYAKGDPVPGDTDISVTRINRWQLLFSYGAGYFINTTKTKRYDLPVSVNGILAVTHLEVQYALSDRYALIGLGRAGVALSSDNTGLIGAGLGGILIRF